MLPPIAERIASELTVPVSQITAAVKLIDEGATVPFIARYRKEATGGLDDTQLRHLSERLVYMRELDERRVAIVESINSQGKLSAGLKTHIESAETKQRLEDLYLPYKVKRRTKAQIAKEAGLEALADRLLQSPTLSPEETAQEYICEPFSTEAGDNPGVADVKAALDGAGSILVERFAEDAHLLDDLRQYQWDNALVVAAVVEEQAAKGEKFRDYFDYRESIANIPPHRALALFRGRSEGVLRINLKSPEELESTGWSLAYSPCERRIAAHFQLRDEGRAADNWIASIVRLTWRAKLGLSIESTLFSQLRSVAEAEAIRVFARNLRDLLLAAPAGAQTTMGLDPGIRTGVKVAVVSSTGKLLDTQTIYPFAPKHDVAGSLATLQRLADKHSVTLVAIGNGTASRETDALVTQLKKDNPKLGLNSVMVSEAGASVYSASELAAREFPALDVSLRGAVSIARRLQDPLAELVKIDPKSIGVGQYQHDANQTQLTKALDDVVEDCVNSVGVDVNTASAPLLARVAGLSSVLAENVVSLRDARGAFRNRKELLDVPRLGPKAYEQAAGFLRVANGDNPLDTSAVHPEAYEVAERMLAEIDTPIDEVMKNPSVLKTLSPNKFTNEKFGLPTVLDILSELEKPGRDPRPEFKTATFNEAVNELKDLRADMVLEGVVTNVTNFGAFVDVGVHQDGLVHISALADRFVKDPHEIVKAGDVVRVKVVEVDVPRKRVGLTMRLAEEGENAPHTRQSGQGQKGKSNNRSNKNQPQTKPMGAMAAAFANAQKK